MARKKLIAANWKMYKTPQQAQAFARAFRPLISKTRHEIVLCPPFIDLAALGAALRGTKIKLGAQNLFWEPEGAFTGEISAAMLKAAACSYVIIGHSERRQFFGETDDSVNRKLRAALQAGLAAIVCVGEQLAEREAGKTEAILQRQCEVGLRSVPADHARRIAIAYEPVWAIGTGRTATPEIAAAAHLHIRDQMTRIFGGEAAARMRIIYGGSVKPENAAALMAEEEIDGALVGGASLDPKSFAAIVNH